MNVFRELGTDLFKIDIVREVGKECFSRSESVDNAEGFFYREMGGVRREAKCIEHQGVQVL